MADANAWALGIAALSLASTAVHALSARRPPRHSISPIPPRDDLELRITNARHEEMAAMEKTVRDRAHVLGNHVNELSLRVMKLQIQVENLERQVYKHDG